MSENEDQFVPPAETMSPPQSIIPSITNDITRSICQLINFTQEGIHEPTCILCSSSYRVEIEKIWVEKGHKHSEVRAFLKEKNIRISDDIIENHMSLHMGRGINEIQKIEYANKIQRLNSIDLTTLDRIKLCLSALTERLVCINSIVPDTECSQVEIEKIKSAETSRLMASFERLLKLQASIMGEMRNDGELITIPKGAFIKFFTDLLAEATTMEEKGIIKKILDGLTSLGK
jgi:hypothetical protein